jgi:hypothetical protein
MSHMAAIEKDSRTNPLRHATLDIDPEMVATGRKAK